jgi:hypothetical protein
MTRPKTVALIATPIIQDMRQTARDLGIVDALLEHQRIAWRYPERAYDLVEFALITLGVSPAALAANLATFAREPDPATKKGTEP